MAQAVARAEGFRDVFRNPHEPAPTVVGALRRGAGRRLQHAGRARGHARVARPRAAAAGARDLRARVPGRARRKLPRRSWTSPRAARWLATRATSKRPTACATSWRPRAGRRATSRAAIGSCRCGDDARPRLRAARRARALPRPARRRRSVGDRARRGADPWLESGPRVQIKPERLLSEAAGTRDHQGVVAWAEPFRYADAYELAREEKPLLVCLDQVTDPHNLGAVVRSAEGAGATGVIVPAHGSARVTPAVSRASAGAVEHLPSPCPEPRPLPRGHQGRRPLDVRRRLRGLALDVGRRPRGRDRTRPRRRG